MVSRSKPSWEEAGQALADGLKMHFSEPGAHLLLSVCAVGFVSWSCKGSLLVSQGTRESGCRRADKEALGGRDGHRAAGGGRLGSAVSPDVRVPFPGGEASKQLATGHQPAGRALPGSPCPPHSGPGKGSAPPGSLRLSRSRTFRLENSLSLAAVLSTLGCLAGAPRLPPVVTTKTCPDTDRYPMGTNSHPAENHCPKRLYFRAGDFGDERLERTVGVEVGCCREDQPCRVSQVTANGPHSGVCLEGEQDKQGQRWAWSQRPRGGTGPTLGGKVSREG